VLGRITALNNRRYNDFHGSRVAFFYHLEMVEDAQVAQAVFDAAFQWAREHNLDTVVGPKGLLRSDAHASWWTELSTVRRWVCPTTMPTMTA